MTTVTPPVLAPVSAFTSTGTILDTNPYFTGGSLTSWTGWLGTGRD